MEIETNALNPVCLIFWLPEIREVSNRSVTLKRLNEVEWREREITGFLSPQALKLIPSFLLYKFMRYQCYNKNFYVEYFISLIISALLF